MNTEKSEKNNLFENFYELKKNGTDIRTEIIAGITTFLTMAYVLAVIPGFLKGAGIPDKGLYTSVCLISIIGTLFHEFYSKLPVATAPGLGLTAFFASTVVGKMGYTWQQGLAAVTISGILFILISFSKIREIIIEGLTNNIGIEGNNRVLKSVQMPLYYKNQNYEELFLVSDMSKAFNEVKAHSGVTLHGILGVTFLTNYEYVLDFQELVAYSKKKL